MSETKVVCPKCGSRSLTLYELWKGHEIEWQQIGGVINRDEGVLNPGNPYAMEAKCKCGHQWRLRNVTQIGNVLK
jgi:hypothetical protein